MRLATDFGRQQWDQYANNKNFILTVTISNKKGKGAGTDKYLWDDSGNLVGATITLGEGLERGYPDPIYYPVMNSLSTENTTYTINSKILAATKLSHEIGHVNQTAKANRSVLVIQNKLMPEYTSIFEITDATRVTRNSLIWLNRWVEHQLKSGKAVNIGARSTQCFMKGTHQ